VSNIIKRKALDFEEYWLMSKAWERRGLPLRAARALVNNGIVTLDDLYRAHELDLATIPGVGQKSLAVLCGALQIDRS
jgi:DNA-directed RNA polymerase alpha subunit